MLCDVIGHKKTIQAFPNCRAELVLLFLRLYAIYSLSLFIRDSYLNLRIVLYFPIRNKLVTSQNSTVLSSIPTKLSRNPEG